MVNNVSLQFRWTLISKNEFWLIFYYSCWKKMGNKKCIQTLMHENKVMYKTLKFIFFRALY